MNLIYQTKMIYTIKFEIEIYIYIYTFKQLIYVASNFKEHS